MARRAVLVDNLPLEVVSIIAQQSDFSWRAMVRCAYQANGRAAVH